MPKNAPKQVKGKKTKKRKIDPTKKRGTDQPFLRLMGIGGAAVLKLIGVDPDEAEEYTFRSVILKERRLEPDIEGLPLLEGKNKRVYIEFQGYSDSYIRYRLASEIMLACTQDKYDGQTFAGIVYTDEAYKKAAIPIKAFGEKTGEVLAESFNEIVLTDYTEEQLTEIDPRLIVLAPFTLAAKMDKTAVISKCRRWKKDVKTVYDKHSVRDALSVMGLFILNRFRNITREEVILMMDFDLRDTVAGQQVFDDGYGTGVIKKARDVIIDVLLERFIVVPEAIKDKVYSIESDELLTRLFRYALRSPNVEDFKKMLSNV